MLLWKPKAGVIYHPKYDGPRHPVSTSKTTLTDVYFLDGDLASYCSFKIDENDRVEIRIKSETGKLIKSKSQGSDIVSGTCYCLKSDTKTILPTKRTIQERNYGRDELDFSKYQARNHCDDRPGGFDTKVFTYLVRVV